MLENPMLREPSRYVPTDTGAVEYDHREYDPDDHEEDHQNDMGG